MTGSGWFLPLDRIFDGFSRYIVAWKLYTTRGRLGDVTHTLELALAALGLRRRPGHRPGPRLLSDNGASYVARDSADWLADKGIAHILGAPQPPPDPGQDRALAPDPEDPRPARRLFPSPGNSMLPSATSSTTTTTAAID